MRFKKTIRKHEKFLPSLIFSNLIKFSKKSRAAGQASTQRKSPSDITAGRAALYRVAKIFDKLVSGKTIFCDCDLNGTLLVTPKNFKCHNITDTDIKHHVYNMILTGDIGLFTVHGCR